MRLPFAPLTEAVGQVWYQLGADGNYGRSSDMDRWQLVKGNPLGVLSELTGFNRRTLSRWNRDGLRFEDADKIAVALGFHVCEIWPEWFEESRGEH